MMWVLGLFLFLVFFLKMADLIKVLANGEREGGLIDLELYYFIFFFIKI